jgi:RNA polymerase sigma-70 factor (ECF subfamily)
MHPTNQPLDITILLRQSASGNRESERILLEVVYARLKEIAGRSLAFERRDHTLQPTALVHEAFLRLLGNGAVEWQDRLHFFAVAARTMRRILVDHARKRLSEKGGGKVVRMEFKEQLHYGTESDPMVVRLHDALNELTQRDHRQGQIVELRYFSGLTEEEIALLLGISSRTVKRDWITAKAWLNAELSR